MPGPYDPVILRVVELCRLYLRAPTTWTSDAAGSPILTFAPPLTTAEQTRFNSISNLAKSLVAGITADEWVAIESDIAGLQQYQNLANPTLAQTVLAVKAQSRILRALIKN